MTVKQAPRSVKKAPTKKSGVLGRKPMFKDEAAVVKILKAESEDKKARHDTCTLHNLRVAVEAHPDLFTPNTKTDKKTHEVTTRSYTQAAIKQAVYRLVTKHKIWLSRSGKS